jgi:GntR family transcriptional regulator/MocR family aminotransferase
VLFRSPSRLWAQLTQRRLRRITPAQLDYGDPAGLRALREGIAEHVAQARGTRCAPEQVVVTAGAQRALETVFRLLLDPGDSAWMEEPGFPGAWSALLAAGARIRTVRVDDEGLDLESALRRETTGRREKAERSGRAGREPRPGAAPRIAYVTPSHQFPLGVPMSLARRLALLRWAGRIRAWIVEDDYDSEFRYGARPIPCLHGLDVDGRVIYVGSFAKTLFPALRLGFVIVPPDLAERFVAARRAADAHPPALEQGVLADFLAGGHFETHLRRMRSAYRERLEALGEAARRHCGETLRLRPVHTGLHGVADLEGVEAETVFREAAARGIEVMPLSAYYLGRAGRRPNALLLGFAPVHPEGLERGMEQLAAAIEVVGKGKKIQPMG